MPIKGPIYRFQPAGLSDALIEDFGFPGCCANLSNLIPHPSNKMLWQARPAAVQVASLGSATGFSSTSFISAIAVVGNRVFGMAASSTFPGFDAPFCYDLITNTFQTISGITGLNIPASASSAYAKWTAPQIAVVGAFVVITHPGYDGVTHFVGFINISNPASLSYTAGNTAINGLTSVPTAVAQFNGRAYYLLNPASGQPGVQATDALLPNQITNPAFALTFGDNVPLSGFGYISLQSPLTGGVVQALLVFKDDSNIYQITGDFSTTISVNTLNVATGTPAINTICNSPLGVLFLSPDGVRLINLQGIVSSPIGWAGQGVVAPFIFAGVPSRAAAAATASVYRISVQNTLAPGSPVQEYWYDLNLQMWSGPHTFPASLIEPWQNTFIVTPLNVPGTLWRSDVQQAASSSYIENGNQLSYIFQTALFADSQQLARININEGFVKIAAFPGMPAPSAFLLDQNGNILNTATLQAGGTPTIWGAFNWGAAVWDGVPNGLVQNPLQWQKPIVFNEGALRITGQSGAGFALGDIQSRAEILGYIPGSP